MRATRLTKFDGHRIDIKGFGAWVKRTRYDKRLTQQQLSELSKVSKGFISQLEIDRAKGITPSTMFDLAIALTGTKSAAENIVEEFIKPSVLMGASESQDEASPASISFWPSIRKLMTHLAEMHHQIGNEIELLVKVIESGEKLSSIEPHSGKITKAMEAFFTVMPTSEGGTARQVSSEHRFG